MELGINGLSLIENPLNPLSLHVTRWANSIVRNQHNLNRTLFLPKQSDLDAFKVEQRMVVGSWKSASARLHFEQWVLPRAAANHGIDLLLYIDQRAPIISPVPVMSFVGVQRQDSIMGVVERVRYALGKAGTGGAIAMLRADDYPSAPGGFDGAPHFIPISSWIDPEFVVREAPENNVSQNQSNWPDEYVLCHGVGSAELSFLLAAWTWVASALGDSFPLVILSESKSLSNTIQRESQSLGVEDSVQTIETIGAHDLPLLYKGAKALINVSHRGWGQQLRWAMASGVPIAAVRDAVHESVLHDAGYLVDPGDSRKLGAACIGLLVEDKLSQSLREKGLERSARFQTPEAQESLIQVILTLSKRL